MVLFLVVAVVCCLVLCRYCGCFVLLRLLACVLVFILFVGLLIWFPAVCFVVIMFLDTCLPLWVIAFWMF